MVDSLVASNFEELYSIHKADYNIGFLSADNLEPAEVKDYLTANFEKLPRMYKCFINKDNFEEDLLQLNELYYVLDESEEKNILINYIKTLISHYADVCDAPELGISLEKVQGNMCKFFHCDMNHLRLVYPLLGPGTLWVKEDNVRREYLGKGKNDQVVKDSKQIFQVPPKTLTLLKGQGHPSAHGKAVVHASPEIPHTQELRVLLRIESIFN